jgi:hypothetical protein
MALDIVFISFYEPNAEDNWDKLKERFPYALHCAGVVGIPQAFIEAARISKTSHVWTVDADNTIKEDFDFSFKPSKGEEDFVHLWYAENPVNNLAYGYGGIKLWPRKFLRDAIIDPFSVDFTVPMAHNETAELKIWKTVASTTRFNTDPFNSYRAGFREGTKLMDEILNLKVATISYEEAGDDYFVFPVRKKLEEAKKRLNAWTTIGEDARFGLHCIEGAIDGAEFGRLCSGDEGLMASINDFDFIREQFKERYDEESVTR